MVGCPRRIGGGTPQSRRRNSGMAASSTSPSSWRAIPKQFGKARRIWVNPRIPQSEGSEKKGLPQNLWVVVGCRGTPRGGTRVLRFLPRTSSSFPLLCCAGGGQGPRQVQVCRGIVYVPRLGMVCPDHPATETAHDAS